MKALLSTLLLIPTFASARPSIFYQTRAEVQAQATPGCASQELARRIRDTRPACRDSIEKWKSYAYALIEVPHSKASRNDSLKEDLAAIIYRNTLITQSYAHLYSMSQESFPSCGRSLLPWVGGASLGSLKSGQVMRSGLSVRVGGIPFFDQFEDGDYRERFGDLFGPLAKTGLAQATLTLGDGNREIFKDLFWQLAAGASCGPRRVVEMLRQVPDLDRDEKLQRALKSWTLLNEAAQTCDSRAVIEANKGFVEVEQYYVGQPVMYAGPVKALGGQALSPIVEAAVPAALGHFPTFMEHARRDHLEILISFANADQRVHWMQDQLEVMENEFQAKRKEVTEPLFCAVVNESVAAREFISRSF